MAHTPSWSVATIQTSAVILTRSSTCTVLVSLTVCSYHVILLKHCQAILLMSRFHPRSSCIPITSFSSPLSSLPTHLILDCAHSRYSSRLNTLHGNGIRMSAYLLMLMFPAHAVFVRPIITFIVILLLPSTLTFITLFIHRVRAARAARLERAPEDVVNNLPILIWTGKCWERHDGKEHSTKTAPAESTSPTPTSASPSTSTGITGEGHPWFEQQVECAICLSEFAEGDRVRILPCQHIFHLEEVDEWLIQRKKLVSVATSSALYLLTCFILPVPRL